MEKLHGRELKIFKSDRGSEFISKDFIRWLDQKGISVETCPPSNHNENGVVERRIGVISRLALTNLTHSGLDPKFYADAYEHVTQILNSTPSKSIDYNIPLVLATDITVRLDKIAAFGCLVVIHSPTAPKGSKGALGVNLGYEESSNSWKILMLETNSIRRSKDAIFHQTKFPFSKNFQSVVNDADSLDTGSSFVNGPIDVAPPIVPVLPVIPEDGPVIGVDGPVIGVDGPVIGLDVPPVEADIPDIPPVVPLPLQRCQHVNDMLQITVPWYTWLQLNRSVDLVLCPL